MIAIIDYGMGNLRSIHNALATVGGNPVIISDSKSLSDADADAVVIPGVGSFGDAMRNLTPFSDRLFDLVDSGTPLLGICIGMQVLFERSEESDVAGFGRLAGDVIRLPDGVKIPQMGWNELTIHRDNRDSMIKHGRRLRWLETILQQAFSGMSGRLDIS